MTIIVNWVNGAWGGWNWYCKYRGKWYQGRPGSWETEVKARRAAEKSMQRRRDRLNAS